jgi:hypothetical protein
MAFDPAPLSDLRGKVRVTGRSPVDYVVRGERVTFRAETFFGSAPNQRAPCNYELRPGRDASVVGSMACEHRDFTVPISLIAPMF